MKLHKLIVLVLCMMLWNGLALTTVSGAENDTGETGEWDQIMENFLEEHHVIPGTVAIGYKNLVTGEEHYVLPDELMLAASMYKVPLNMYYANKVYLGEMDWDTPIAGVDYSQVMEWSIINSNNEYSGILWRMIGNFTEFRDAMRPLIGEVGTELPPLFYRENYFTPRQLIYCLNELYQNREQYPNVIECMMQGKPTQYFKEREHGIDIAQKYGYLDDGHTVVNNCGILYTREPFALAVFTTNAYHGYNVIVDLCDCMIEYTDAQINLRESESCY